MKYIIFDMDDTLLNDKREITPYTLEVLKKLQAMGHKLVCNTARSKGFNQKYFDQIRPDYAILNGGAMIIDKDEKVIFRAEVDVPTTQAIIKELVGLTETIYVQTMEEFYSHMGRNTVQKACYFDFDAAVFPYPAQKIVADIKDDARAEALAEQYHLAFTTYMGGTFRRYNHIDATKALGNRNLMKLVGGSLEEVIAFGDDHGDMEMLREAGVGVLMKNANPALHEGGLRISEYTNDEDGVAKFLEEYFAT